MLKRTKRILVAKAGLDSHDRGAKIIARALMNAGMEVIYSGIRCTPEQIVNIAIEESVDIIGLSILSGAHVKLTTKVLQILKEKHADEIKVVLGGPISKKDTEHLKEIGVAEIFTSGMKINDIVCSIEKLIDDLRNGTANTK